MATSQDLDGLVLGAISEFCPKRVEVDDSEPLDYDKLFSELLPQNVELSYFERQIAIRIIQGVSNSRKIDFMVGMTASALELCRKNGTSLFEARLNSKGLNKSIPIQGYEIIRILRFLQSYEMATFEQRENSLDGIDYRFMDHPVWYVLLATPQFRTLAGYVHSGMLANSGRVTPKKRTYDLDVYNRLFTDFADSDL